MVCHTLQVLNSQQAVEDMEKELGFPVQGYMPGTSSVPDRLKIDIAKLKSYLQEHVGLVGQGEWRNCVHRVLLFNFRWIEIILKVL